MNRYQLGMTSQQRNDYVLRSVVSGFYSQVRNLPNSIPVPLTILQVIRDNIFQQSKLVKYVNLQPVSGNSRQIISDSLLEAVWVDAFQSLKEFQVDISGLEMESYRLGGFIPICTSTLKDGDYILSGEFEYKLTQAISYALDKAIIYGTDRMMPLGFATRLADTLATPNLVTTNIRKIDDTALDGTGLIVQMIAELMNAKGNKSTRGMVLAMNETTWKGSILPAAVSASCGLITTANGGYFPALDATIEFLDFIPDGDIVGGYLEKYLLAERSGATIGVSDQVRFLTDEVVFRGTANYDGAPVNPDSFILLNINNREPATTVPFAEV